MHDSECIICNVINKTLKSFIVYEDDLFIAFLDIKPLFPGHCLLAPKQHVHTIYDFPDKEGNKLLHAVKKLGNAITAAMNAQGTFIAMNNIVSQSIDHMHVHIVPRNKGDGLKGFFWPRMRYESEEHMRETQQAIKKLINN